MSSEIFDDFQKFQQERAGGGIADIYKALVVDPPLKTMPESVFINEILPIITGKTTNTDLAVLVAGIAGSPFLDIDIVDASGNKLFTMPSVCERNIFDHKEASKRGSMQSFLITAGQLKQQSPHRANNYMAHEFNQRGIATNAAELVSGRRAKWAAIFARYGVTFESTDANGRPVATPIAETKKAELDIDNGELF